MNSILPLKFFYPKLSTDISVICDKEKILSFKLSLPKLLKSIYQKKIVFDFGFEKSETHEIFDLYSTKKILNESKDFDIPVNGGSHKETGYFAMSCHLLVNSRGDTFDQQVQNHIDYTCGDFKLHSFQRSKVQLQGNIAPHQKSIVFLQEPAYSSAAASCGMYLMVNDMYSILITVTLSIHDAGNKSLCDTVFSIAQPLFNNVSIRSPDYVQEPFTRSPENQVKKWLTSAISPLSNRDDKEISMLAEGLITKEQCETRSAKKILQTKDTINLANFTNFKQKIHIPEPQDSNDLVIKAMLDDIRITADKLRNKLYP